MRRFIGGVLVAAATLWGVGSAQAAAIVDGKMKIDFTNEIHDLVVHKINAKASAWGNAHYDAEHFRFYLPASGGYAKDGKAEHAVMHHDGGGMYFAAERWQMELGHFVVDTHEKLIKSSIRAWKAGDDHASEMKDVPIFHLAKNNHGAHAFAMTWTPDAAEYLGKLLGDDHWSAGGLAATGNIDMEVVPVPAALPLLATALGGLGFALHRRRRRAAV